MKLPKSKTGFIAAGLYVALQLYFLYGLANYDYQRYSNSPAISTVVILTSLPLPVGFFLFAVARHHLPLFFISLISVAANTFFLYIVFSSLDTRLRNFVARFRSPRPLPNQLDGKTNPPLPSRFSWDVAIVIVLLIAALILVFAYS